MLRYSQSIRKCIASLIFQQQETFTRFSSSAMLSLESKTSWMGITLATSLSLLVVAASLAEPQASPSTSYHCQEIGWFLPGTDTVKKMQELLRLRQLTTEEGEHGHETRDTTTSALVASTPQKEEAYFPSLQASVYRNQQQQHQHQQPFVINSSTPFPIESDLFQGSVRLVLKPLQAVHDKHYNATRQPKFMLEIQGQFIQELPRHSIYMGAQIDKPVMEGIGAIGRRVCSVLLMLLGQKIPGNMHYSFGTQQELPVISFPLASAMTEITLDKDEALVQHKQGGDWRTDCQYTFKYIAESIDLAAWKVAQPFEFPLQRIWGEGTPLELIIYHQEAPESPRSYLLRLKLQPTPMVEYHTSTVEATLPASEHLLATTSN